LVLTVSDIFSSLKLVFPGVNALFKG